MSYISDHLGSSVLHFIFFAIVLVRFRIDKKINVAVLILVTLLFFVPSCYNTYVYFQFKIKPTQSTIISVESIDVKGVRDFGEKHRRTLVFIESTDGEEYLVANDEWESRLRNLKGRINISDTIKIEYKETVKFNAITEITQLY